jgi:putative salt-induced outer membrane protein YdiY
MKRAPHLHLRSLRWGSLVVALGLVLFPSMLRAQATPQLPRGTLDQTPLDRWQSNIVVDRFLAAQRRQREEEEIKHVFQLSLALGGMLAGGNSRFIGGSSDAKLRWRNDDDQFTARIAANYSRGAPAGREPETTVENVQGRARYDRFFLEKWVGFFGVQGRRDRFQGLDLRMQFDPGLGYYLLNESDERIWFEAGYDLLYDIRRDDAIVARDAANQPILDPAGNPVRLEKARSLHSGRLFIGYSAEFSDSVTFIADFEYMQAISSVELFRLNAAASVNAKIKNKWSIATTFTLNYENTPLPDKEPLDTTTSVNLVYSFF